jgi:hypothetical protein
MSITWEIVHFVAVIKNELYLPLPEMDIQDNSDPNNVGKNKAYNLFQKCEYVA